MPHRADPFGPVLALGGERSRLRAAAALAGALFVHAGAAARGATALLDMRSFADGVRGRVGIERRAAYDVEVARERPPPPEPVRAPEPEPAAPAPRRPRDPHPPAPPPAPAEAGKLLTAETDPDEPVDLTAEGFVVGTSDRYAGGITASDGVSKRAVREAPTRVGGAADAPRVVARAPTALPSRARTAAPSSRNWSDCGFPAEADREQMDYARVSLVVSVAPNGTPSAVAIVSDPGFGFGRLAKQCALRKRYQPALSRAGVPVAASTPPFTVTFRR